MAAPPAFAQSIVRGEIEGIVRSQHGGAVSDASVLVTDVRTGNALFEDTDRDGAYRVPLLRPGEYEVRFEAMGYVPRLYQGVQVAPGQTIRLSVELEPAPPPVHIVDTVFAGARTSSRFDGQTGRRIGRTEIAAFPDPRMSFGSLAARSPVLDEALGSEGLPGRHSLLVLDGLPFRPAAHPLQTSGAGDLPLFPWIALDHAEVARRPDVEWAGAPGSYVSLMSRPAARETAVEFFGAGTTGALWQSEPFSGQDSPDMHSVWAGGAAHLPMAGGNSQFFLGIEGLQSKSPHLSPLSGDVASRFVDTGLQDEVSDPAELTAPWLGTLQSVSGLGRLDWRVADNAEVMTRVAFASQEDGGERFFSGPLRYGRTPPMKGSDLSALVAVLVDVHPRVDLEIRAGFERSNREWRGTDAGGGASVFPSTRFTGAGVLLGADPGLFGSVTRTALIGEPTVHVRFSEHQLKGGLAVSVPSYEYEHVYRSQGEFLFGEPEDMTTGEGVFLRTVGAGFSRSFSAPEVGIFAQHGWEPIQGIRMTTGVRVDREGLPTDDVPLNQRWEELTGIRNNDFTSGLLKVSSRFGVVWDLTGDGGTLVEGSVATHHGSLDPAALNEVISLSGPVRQRRQVGGVSSWPDLPPSGGDDERPVLAMFGPDVAAPQTARANFGLSQRLGGGTVLHLSGTMRRTRFLLRRSDLNLTLQPGATLQDGRSVYGTLTKMGSVVVAEPGSNRRFGEFDQVWALNSDGWSEYQALTMAVEHSASDLLDLFADYTYSITEDNLVGARWGTPEARMKPRLGSEGPDRWDEATSDFDVPHRATVGARARFGVLEGAEVAGIYRFRSGLPYTPGFRAGVDLSGDGSGFNDPAFVEEGGTGPQACLNADVGRFASRNGCRGDSVSFLDLHVVLGLFRFGPSVASLTVDLFNLLDAELGLPDHTLHLVDGGEPLSQDPDSGAVIVPLVPNPSFGVVGAPQRPGRMIRVGFRVALP
jgi:hypothetical protein